jgi:hypothetical protein
MTPQEMDAFTKSLTETESALMIAAGMAMFSAIEAGAPKLNLVQRLKQHELNYQRIGQPRAAQVIQVFLSMVNSIAKP